MPPDTSDSREIDDSPVASPATSRLLLWIAGIALVGNCLLTSPSRFSEKHLQDPSLLRHVIDLLALGGRWPTYRGIEIRNLFFYLGAAVLAFSGSVALLRWNRRPRVSMDDLLDLRTRAGSPIFWWLLFLLVVVLSTLFSRMSGAIKGQAIIHFMHFAWWLPLAVLLTPADMRRLSIVLLIALSATAFVGIWYQWQRGVPTQRLQFPIGNELWLAACLLPGLFIAAGLGVDRWFRSSRSRPAGRTYREGRTAAWLFGLTACAVILAVAMYLTRSRSAIIGIGAGLATFVAMSVRRRMRAATILATLLLAAAGAWYVMGIRGETAMGHRMHSIRARVDHEWAYALSLWMQKQVAGHGDGAYPLMTGVSARVDQLDDPIAVGFNDERSWVTHAHNEFLEILSDLGAVGLIAYVGMFVACLYYALRFADRARAGGPEREHLGLAIGLAAALVALLIEQCSDNALRQPGLPPIFLTVWACLWAVVRDARPTTCHPERSEGSQEADRLGLGQVRMAGFVGILGASTLGYFAVMDWRGSLAQQAAIQASTPGQFDDAVQSADAASAWMLDPFQGLNAKLTAARALQAKFHERLRTASSSRPLTEDDFNIAHESLRRLDQLNRDAPRFLQVSRLQATLWRDLTSVFTRAKDERNRAGSQAKWIEALTASAADEPFNDRPVLALWQLKTDASIVDRLQWLCRLMRGGELSSAAQELFRRLQQFDVSNLDPALNGMLTIADQDQQLPATAWRHRFSPEIYRLGALANRNQGEFAGAVKMADQAVAMYEAAGSRLFWAHAAAIHESALYGFLAAPRDETDKHLACLARSRSIIEGRPVPDGPMPTPQGFTRLLILLAAGREEAARKQLAILSSEAKGNPDQSLGDAFIALAALFSRISDQREACLAWIQRGRELSPDHPQQHLLLAQIHLSNHEDRAALDALRHCRTSDSDKTLVDNAIQRLRQEFPDSTVWSDSSMADLTAPATQPADNVAAPTSHRSN